MDSENTRDQLAQFAQESANIEPQGRKLTPDTATLVQDIGAGLVEALVEQAQTATQLSITDTLPAWNNVVETLAALGLDTQVCCAKTGKPIYTLSPDHFTSYLDALDKLGESHAADQLQTQLLNAVLSQQASTILPCHLTTSAQNVAFLRDAAPVDYALIALSKAFPIVPRAQSLDGALYVHSLAQSRRVLETLQPTALAYLCECLHLYISNIRPDAIAARDPLNTLSVYEGQTIAAIVHTPNKIAHLCRRIVQLAFNLIAKHRPRKLTHLSTKDLLALRVHYVGLPHYKEQRKHRREQQTARTLKLKIAAQNERAALSRALVTPAMQSLLDANQTHADDIDLELFDMAAAFNTALDQPVRLAPASEKQAGQFNAIKKAARATRAERDENSVSLVDMFTDDLLLGFADLDSDFDGGDFMPALDTSQDLIDFGYAEQDEYDSFLEDQEDQEESDDYDDPDDEQEETQGEATPVLSNSTIFDIQINAAMAQAKPQPTRIAPKNAARPQALGKASPASHSYPATPPRSAPSTSYIKPISLSRPKPQAEPQAATLRPKLFIKPQPK